MKNQLANPVIKRETDKALLIECDSGAMGGTGEREEFWIPKSQIDENFCLINKWFVCKITDTTNADWPLLYNPEL